MYYWDSYDISANFSTTKAIQVAFLCNKAFCCCFERYSQIVFYISYLISRWMFFIITLQEKNGVLCICHVVYCSDICVERTSHTSIESFTLARDIIYFWQFYICCWWPHLQCISKRNLVFDMQSYHFDAMYYIQV